MKGQTRRLAALHRIVKVKGVAVPDEVVHHIANSSTDTDRVRSVMIAMIASAQLLHREITLSLADEVIKGPIGLRAILRQLEHDE